MNDPKVYVNEFQNLDAALAEVNLSTEKRNVLYSILAGILHLGNISFEETSSGCTISGSTRPSLVFASKCLNVNLTELEFTLLNRKMRVKSNKDETEIW